MNIHLVQRPLSWIVLLRLDCYRLLLRQLIDSCKKEVNLCFVLVQNGDAYRYSSLVVYLGVKKTLDSVLPSDSTPSKTKDVSPIEKCIRIGEAPPSDKT